MVKNEFLKIRIWLGLKCNDYRSLKLNMAMQIELKKMKMASGLIKNIKGYHIHFKSPSNSYIKKNYDGYIVSPVLLLVHYVLIR
jgi:hypothetical protein